MSDTSSRFPLVGKTSFTILLFVLAMAIWHCLLPILGPAWRGWKHVDYLWLVVVGLGLLSATQAARTLIAENLLHTASVYHGAAIKHALTSAWSIQRPYRAWIATHPDGPQRELAECRAAAKYFERAESVLTENPADYPQLESQLAELGGEGFDGGLSGDKEWFQQALTAIGETQDEVTRLENRAMSTALEDLRTILYPWLLSVALAAKITSVTAAFQMT